MSVTAVLRPKQGAAGTVVAKSYLSLARVLAKSFHRYHPDVPFFVVLADEVDGYFAPEAEPFRLVGLAELQIPNLCELRFRYSQQELTYATAPYLLGYLLERGFANACFFKQESLVVGDLGPILALLDRCSILLTPHLLRPLGGSGGIERELNILQSGVYNVGFLGVSGTPATRAFLAWWQDRVQTHCRHAVGEGMHYEQRWLDLVPGFFEDVHTVRDPGFNVGHWNLPEREVQIEGGKVLVDGGPGRYFRFSGFEPDRPMAVTKYSPRLTLRNVGPAAELFRCYLALLEVEGFHESRAWPYAYGRFDNGTPIPGLAREMYAELGEAARGFGDPFETAPVSSYFNWLNSPVEGDSVLPSISRLWRKVYERRRDVQLAFPDPAGADREKFLAWAANSGAREHSISEGLVPDLTQWRKSEKLRAGPETDPTVAEID